MGDSSANDTRSCLAPTLRHTDPRLVHVLNPDCMHAFFESPKGRDLDYAVQLELLDYATFFALNISPFPLYDPRTSPPAILFRRVYVTASDAGTPHLADCVDWTAFGVQDGARLGVGDRVCLWFSDYSRAGVVGKVAGIKRYHWAYVELELITTSPSHPRHTLRLPWARAAPIRMPTLLPRLFTRPSPRRMQALIVSQRPLRSLPKQAYRRSLSDARADSPTLPRPSAELGRALWLIQCEQGGDELNQSEMLVASTILHRAIQT